MSGTGKLLSGGWRKLDLVFATNVFVIIVLFI